MSLPGLRCCERCLFYEPARLAAEAACAAPLCTIIRSSVLGVLFGSLPEDVIKLKHANWDVDFGLERLAAGEAETHLVVAQLFTKRLLGRLGSGGLVLGHQRHQASHRQVQVNWVRLPRLGIQ